CWRLRRRTARCCGSCWKPRRRRSRTARWPTRWHRSPPGCASRAGSSRRSRRCCGNCRRMSARRSVGACGTPCRAAEDADLSHRSGRGTVGGARHGGSSPGADPAAGAGGARRILPARPDAGGTWDDGGGAAARHGPARGAAAGARSEPGAERGGDRAAAGGQPGGRGADSRQAGAAGEREPGGADAAGAVDPARGGGDRQHSGRQARRRFGPDGGAGGSDPRAVPRPLRVPREAGADRGGAYSPAGRTTGGRLGARAGGAPGGAQFDAGADRLCRSLLVGGQIGLARLGVRADRRGASHHRRGASRRGGCGDAPRRERARPGAQGQGGQGGVRARADWLDPLRSLREPPDGGGAAAGCGDWRGLYTELVTLKVAGDPQLHSHVAVPNVALTDTGRVGGLDLQRLEGRVHEWGALYQAHLATNLRASGIEVVLDEATGAARITAIPEQVRAAFSKRTQGGTEAARAYAAGLGLDWDRLDAERRIGLAKRGVQGNPRAAKQDDLSDWKGWRHASVLRGAPIPLPAREARLEQAYQAALGLLERDLQRRAVVDASVARVAAARGLIASGVERAAEIDDVVRAFAVRGVRQDGQTVGLIWGQMADPQGRDRIKLTTTLHVERESELVSLAQAAAADRSGALDAAAIDAAVARSGLDFSASAHGRQQRVLIDALGQGGRLAVAIGVA